VTFVAPPEKEIEWTDAGLEGSFRFLARVWRLVDAVCDTIAGDGIPAPTGTDLDESERALRRKTHDTIRRVTQDLDPRVHLNTAVSALMELVNELYQFCDRPGRSIAVRRGETAAPAGVVERKETVAVLKEAVEALVLMLSPFAPHMSEELWERLGHTGGIAATAWPEYDAEVAKAEEVVVPVQINGKVRARLTVAAGTSDDDLQVLALADPQVQANVKGKPIKKLVVVNGGKLVSIVV
jgi:leucyl-tRNA synthetase